MVTRLDRLKQISESKLKTRSPQVIRESDCAGLSSQEMLQERQTPAEPRLLTTEKDASQNRCIPDEEHQAIAHMIYQTKGDTEQQGVQEPSASKSMLYATLFAAENSTGVPQIPAVASQAFEQDKMQTFTPGLDQFFAENRDRNSDAQKPAPVANPVMLKGGSTSQMPAPSNGRDTLRGRDDSKYYITSVNAKRNPDLIIPGGAIKGNMYFRRHIDPDKEEPLTTDSQVGQVPETGEEDDMQDEDDLFNRMKNRMARYYTDSNPTIKCRNCKQFGHMARECPNERSRPNCILCGKDTHDSFDCDAKLCFKCNQVGHKANECTKTDVMKCLACGQIGHQQARCLKVWVSAADGPSSSQGQHHQSFSSAKRDSGQQETKMVSRHSAAAAKYMRCIDCGNTGHFKCSKEAQSALIKLTFKVEDNLDEFFLMGQKEHCVDNMITYEVSQQQSPQQARVLRKRDNKQKRKTRDKIGKVYGDSNAMQGPNRMTGRRDRDESSSDQDCSDQEGGVNSYSSDQSGSESSSSSSSDGGGGAQYNRFAKLGKRTNKTHRSSKQNRQKDLSSYKVQCYHCAEFHEPSDCTFRRNTGRYQQYENVRNRFAKDVTFNYRRGHETYVPSQHESNSMPHHPQLQNLRSQDNSRSMNYHHASSFSSHSRQPYHGGSGSLSRYHSSDANHHSLSRVSDRRSDSQRSNSGWHGGNNHHYGSGGGHQQHHHQNQHHHHQSSRGFKSHDHHHRQSGGDPRSGGGGYHNSHSHHNRHHQQHGFYSSSQGARGPSGGDPRRLSSSFGRRDHNNF